LAEACRRSHTIGPAGVPLGHRYNRTNDVDAAYHDPAALPRVAVEHFTVKAVSVARSLRPERP
jgi:hypothetical protein